MSFTYPSPHRKVSARGALSPWKKHTARITVPEGGSDPTNFWAAESRKSGVAPARFGVFSTVTLAFAAFSISRSFKRLLLPQAEELAEVESDGCSSYLLHFFLSGSCSGTATRQSTSVAKCTVAWRLLQPKSRRMSESLTRPTFIRDRDARSVARRIGSWIDSGKSGPRRSQTRTDSGPRLCGFGSSGPAPPKHLIRVGL